MKEALEFIGQNDPSTGNTKRPLAINDVLKVYGTEDSYWLVDPRGLRRLSKAEAAGLRIGPDPHEDFLAAEILNTLEDNFDDFTGGLREIARVSRGAAVLGLSTVGD